ncbi:DUF2795 domain-containing protein [Luteibacter sp. PPL201]|uniref:DUF2795 domain-containing protein n=1 Tax=Luteibacter sahnii TaxID=3021977 RepID=A0ABT6BDH6_9GAMM|nr:DUF2795 domain-containing protein [Luteibacter sp. PPL193]MDY1549341.1 DUF2795 domain-containing protein [Luteibacter sp. PPL193]
MTRGVGGRSPAHLQTYLEGVSYPTDKTGLRDAAERNDAPDEILDLIEELDDRQYGGPQDVMKAYGKVE